MKKTFIILITTAFLLLGLSYTLLFTPLGNTLLKPTIEKKINEHSPIPLTLDTFLLSTDTLKLIIKLDEENTLLFEGVYSLFSQDFDIEYEIRLLKLSNLNTLLQRQLTGKLQSEGKIKGNPDLFKIKGISDIASSDTQYAVVIKEMALDKAAIKLVDMDIKTLLQMLGEKIYSIGKLDLHVQLNEFDPTNRQGNILLEIKEAKLDAKILKDEFGVKVNKTSLEGNVKAKFEGTKITYLAHIDSALAKLYSKGDINTANNNIDAAYKIDIEELALLKSITNAPLRGPLSTEGKLHGKEKFLDISGNSDLAGSQTLYHVNLIDFKPSKLKLKVKEASVKKILYMLHQPDYAQGDLNLQANLTSVSPLDGNIKFSIAKGIANKKEIKKAFDITLPYTSFELVSDATVKNDKIIATTAVNSNLATVKMQRSDFDIKSAALHTDYEIFIPSLERFETILDKKLLGELKAKGEIKKDKNLTITAHSNIFDGVVDAKIIDDNIDATFKELHAIKVLKMLGYPRIMNAPINGTLSYNMKKKQGKLNSSFKHAILMRSQMTDLVSGLTRTDLTKERFNEGSLDSIINKEVITSDLKMRSKRVNLKSKKFIINSKKQLIDARFALKIKKYEADVLVTQNINSPKVRIDARSAIETELKEKSNKELEKLKEKGVKELNRFLQKLF